MPPHVALSDFFKINFFLLLKLKYTLIQLIVYLAHILLLHVSSEDTVIPICDFFLTVAFFLTLGIK